MQFSMGRNLAILKLIKSGMMNSKKREKRKKKKPRLYYKLPLRRHPFLYPVALDAKAELLESRALTSMMQYSRDDG